ncbi:MAG: phosphopantetheine-binding protein [Flammeovirgaceae bacterium]|jgi:acyl carrier protein|nr:phosphopantetheine-binding protein [Flammeovirgaceae bacterium]
MSKKYLTKAEAMEHIKGELKKAFDVAGPNITEHTRLQTLIDSLEQMELIMRLEREFSIVILDSETARITTLGELAELVQNKTSMPV